MVTRVFFIMLLPFCRLFPRGLGKDWSVPNQDHGCVLGWLCGATGRALGLGLESLAKRQLLVLLHPGERRNEEQPHLPL